MSREPDSVRVRVAAIVIRDGRSLVQRPTDDPHACFAFVGGGYEPGDTFESRLRQEFEEETTARVVRAEYRFVVENRFRIDGRTVQSLEHFFEVGLDREQIESNEPALTQHWVPLSELGGTDLRPWVVRDAIITGEYRRVRHLVVPFPSVAIRLAEALDAEDYALARSLLADDCTYHTGTGTLTGPEAIIASYRDNGEKARSRYDAIEYASRVEPSGPTEAVITYIDRVRIGEAWHVYHCRQHVRVGGSGLVVAVRHEELPGERERLLTFERDASDEETTPPPEAS